jgi:hypothetical protein
VTTKNKQAVDSVVGQTCNNDTLDSISAIKNCHPFTAVNRTMTAEENERITNERDLNDPLHYAHQGVASAIRRTRITKTFYDRIKDLQAFKDEHGHCNVPVSKSDKNSKYQSLGKWCSNTRHTFKQIKQGETPSYYLSDANIQRLERMGFRWSLRVRESISFDDRMKDQPAFKDEHGHWDFKNDPRANVTNGGTGSGTNRSRSHSIQASHYHPNDGHVTHFYPLPQMMPVPGYAPALLYNYPNVNSYRNMLPPSPGNYPQHGRYMYPPPMQHQYPLLMGVATTAHQYPHPHHHHHQHQRGKRKFESNFRTVTQNSVSHQRPPTLHYAHQGVASAIRSGSNDSTRITKTFDDHIKDLQAFKEEHGHCNVSQSKSDKNKYQSLGRWCCNIRRSYKMVKQEGPTPTNILKLSDVNIQRLERMGFEWSLRVYEERISFDDRIKDLQSFKEEHGHCNVTLDKNTKYKSLGSWCKNLRHSYRKIKQGREPRYKLSDDIIQYLERMGFDFKLRECVYEEKISFDDRMKDLQAFKEEHGHCNVSKSYSDKNKYRSLGNWCGNIRSSYKKIKQGETPKINHLSDAKNIQLFEAIGFKWNLQEKK